MAAASSAPSSAASSAASSTASSALGGVYFKVNRTHFDKISQNIRNTIKFTLFGFFFYFKPLFFFTEYNEILTKIKHILIKFHEI